MSRPDWNSRYDTDEYIYGCEPNSFLVEQVDLIRGPVLSLAEGEGRNAVFLASRGHDVLGVDASEIGLNKARALATERGVSIRTEVADLGLYEPTSNHFGAVVSIWAHLPSVVRGRLYPLVIRSLVPGGLLLLEAYSERQLQRDTGGPKDIDMLLSTEKLSLELGDLEVVLLRETEREVVEGAYHTGLASVVQFIGRKKAMSHE